MPHTYSRILIHVIFSTKDREPALDPEIRPKLWAYIAGIIRKSGGEAIIVNRAAEHVHALFVLPARRSVSEMVRLIKSNSSKWMHETHLRSGLGWQRGYAAFSVSQSIFQVALKYVANQEEHHRKKSFQEEYRGFLQKHGVSFEERYISD